MEACLRLTSKEVIGKVSLRDVAAEAKIAAGSFYTYFSDMDDLLSSMYEHWLDRKVEAMTYGDESSLSSEDRLKLYWENLFTFYQKHPDVFDFMRQFAHSPLFTKKILDGEIQKLDSVITAFERGIAQGDFRYMHPTAMLYILSGHAASCARLHLAGKVDIIDYQMDVVKQSCWDSLRSMKY